MTDRPDILTLGQVRAERPCADGWVKLLTALGQSTANPDMTVKVSIGDVAKANGVSDAMWCMRWVDDRRLAVRMVLPAVKRASAFTEDQRVHDCIAAVDRWLVDEAVDLSAAHAAAHAAAWAAAHAAAHAAAWAAAWAAAAAAAEAHAAHAAEWAAEAAAAAERTQQVRDIIAVSPLHAFKENANA